MAVVGPTATGKTALAVELARRLGGEVVNADSMQLYRGMDIGTAKPDAAERGGVPHHLLDLWHVREPASVAEYRQRARAEIDRLRAAGVVPLLVGGSGLYVRAVLDELDFPGTDAAVRARLEAELEEFGAAALHARLATVDPAAAAAVLPGNGRRIVRALEVVEITGGPFRATMPEPVPHYPAVVARAGPGPGRARRAGRPAGGPDVGRRASSRRWRRWPPTVCARAPRPRARWATRRCWPSSTAPSPRTRRGSGPSSPPAGSSAGSAPGSAVTRPPPGSTPPGPTCSTPLSP